MNASRLQTKSIFRRATAGRVSIVVWLTCVPLGAALLMGSHSRARQSAQSMADAARTVAYVEPSEIPVGEILSHEAAGADKTVATVLKTADALVRQGVKYRFDDKLHVLNKRQVGIFQPELSCSEFAWYVFSRAGLDLGNKHLQTRELAFRQSSYAASMDRVTDGSIKPGDMLVYEYPQEDLEREQRKTGKCHSGHAVIVVSAKDKIVVGSHFFKSTPTGAPTGAGYRQLLAGWDHWTDGRTLRAVYRAKHAWAADPAPSAAPHPLKTSPPGTLAGK